MKKIIPVLLIAVLLFSGCSLRKSSVKTEEQTEVTPVPTSYVLVTPEPTIVIPDPTPAPVEAETVMPTPAPVAATPAPTARPTSSGNVDIEITKQPTEETLEVGGYTQFIAHADGANSVIWYTIDPDGNTHSFEETREMFPNLKLQYQYYGDYLFVGNVPIDLDGWKFVARYSNEDGWVDTNPADLFVVVSY